MIELPRKAMVLSAGLGMRMRPLTEKTPKPLIEVGGKALIDWGLDTLQAAGVGDAVVNVHHLADQMEAHLAKRSAPAITISDERLPCWILGAVWSRRCRGSARTPSIS